MAPLGELLNHLGPGAGDLDAVHETRVIVRGQSVSPHGSQASEGSKGDG